MRIKLGVISYILWRNVSLLTLSLLYCCVANSPCASAQSLPNIVLIMADDMGYTDIGCYGSEIRTPILDKLAKNGLRFTQFYNTSRCCPTRAALLTGLYSHQAGIGLMTGDRGYDSYRGTLNRKCITIAEALKARGYRSYMSGKWHVTSQTKPDGDKSNWPLQRGFDRFYGTIIGAGSFYDPATLCRGNTFITPVNDDKYQPETFYYSDAISDNAVRFVADHQSSNPGQPFFMYVSYTSAHWPMHAPEGDVKRYQGVYDEGFTPIREARYQKALELGVLESRWPMSPTAQDWADVKNKNWDIRNMEVYAAMIDRMDQGIGKIIAELDRHAMLENTVVIYLQDNGGCAEGYGRRPNKPETLEKPVEPMGPNQLQTKIWPPIQTRDGRWLRTGPEAMAGPEDTFVAYGRGWASVSNTPFRGFKHDAYEGGISTPFIVHWPKGIQDEVRGSIVKHPCHLIDVMPTLIDIADAKYPERFSDNQLLPLEGISMLLVFSGQSLVRENPIGFEHHGNQALRDGKWKIVSQYQSNQRRQWELYDMQADRTELNDLAGQKPELVKQMVAKWNSWADRVGVVDWPFENKKN